MPHSAATEIDMARSPFLVIAKICKLLTVLGKPIGTDFVAIAVPYAIALIQNALATGQCGLATTTVLAFHSHRSRKLISRRFVVLLQP